jgi:hypothetical protein
MSTLGAIVLVVLTSLAGYLVGTRQLGLSRPGLGSMVQATLEAIGLGAIFMVANLGLDMLVIALVRVGGGRFVSAYAVDDLGLAAASLLQGVLFRWWWSRR